MKEATKTIIELAIRNDDQVDSQTATLVMNALNSSLPSQNNYRTASPEEPLLLSMNKAAAKLGVSRVTFWRLVNTGGIKPIEIFEGVFRYNPTIPRRRDWSNRAGAFARSRRQTNGSRRMRSCSTGTPVRWRWVISGNRQKALYAQRVSHREACRRMSPLLRPPIQVHPSRTTPSFSRIKSRKSSAIWQTAKCQGMPRFISAHRIIRPRHRPRNALKSSETPLRVLPRRKRKYPNVRH